MKLWVDVGPTVRLGMIAADGRPVMQGSCGVRLKCNCLDRLSHFDLGTSGWSVVPNL
jgi:hypothetical protein